MLVNLMQLPDVPKLREGILIKRALIVDKNRILDFVNQFFEGWDCEVEKALMSNPGGCFIAVRERELVGFACYDSTAPDFFGPTGVREDMRGKGVGKALLIRTLHAMREAGYVYAVIGAVNDAAEFYEKTVGARFIEGGEVKNSVYSQMIKI